MTEYNAIAEVGVRPNRRNTATWLDRLDGYSPAIGVTDQGTSEVIITLDEDLFEVAVTRALAVLRNAIGELLALTVMPTDVWDARVENQQVDVDLVDTQEAARLLDVTRQRVQQLAAEGGLPHCKIGNSYAFPRSAVERAAQIARTSKRGDAGRVKIPAGAEPFRPKGMP